MLAALILAAVLVAGVAIALIASRGGGSHGSATRPAAKPAAVPAPGSPASAGPVVVWIARNLATSSRFVADPGIVTGLRAKQFGNLISVDGARTIPAAPSGGLQFDYVVATSAIRASAAANSSLRSALAGSAPIAVFGSGTSEVVVRQVSAETGARTRPGPGRRRAFAPLRREPTAP